MALTSVRSFPSLPRMAKKKSAGTQSSGGASVPASRAPAVTKAREDACPTTKPKTAARPSALLDTRVVYCGDNLEQLQKLPDACVDLIYIDPPFNSNRNYEVFWGETKEKRAFEDRHENTTTNLSAPKFFTSKLIASAL